MRSKIINLFFFVNFINSVVGIISAIKSYSDQSVSEINSPLLFLGLIEMILLLPALWILSTAQGIPRKAFLPVFMIGVLPFLFVEDSSSSVHIIVSLTTLSTAIYSFDVRRRFTGNKVGVFPEALIAKNNNAFKRAVPVFAIFLASVLICIGISVYRMADELLFEKIKDSVFVRYDGIYTRSYVYKKAEKSVFVFSMLHYADRSFYDSMFRKVPQNDSIILLEGILDREGLYGSGVPHTETGYGLTSQFGTFNKWVAKDLNAVDADMDVSDFDKLLQTFVVNEFKRGSIFEKALASDSERKQIDRLTDRKFNLRNEHMIKTFDLNESNASNIVFTWGAMHNPFIMSELEKRGYIQTSSFEVKAVAFW